MTEEIITLYTKEAPDVPVSCGRNEYYDNDFTTYKAHYPALIDVLLFNKHGDLLLQKRARNKRVSPGLLHTTVGGHITWGDAPSFSVVHECMEELGAPALVFSKEKYEQAYEKLGEYARRAALLCEVGELYRNFSDDQIESRRDIKDRIWVYLGRYDGPIESPDRSSAGYEWMDLETLRKEFATKPDQFTDGIKIYLETHGQEMEDFVEKYCKR